MVVTLYLGFLMFISVFFLDRILKYLNGYNVIWGVLMCPKPISVRVMLSVSRYRDRYGLTRVYRYHYVRLPNELVRDVLHWGTGDVLDAFVIDLPCGGRGLLLCKGCGC